MAPSIATTIATSLALIDQFLASLETTTATAEVQSTSQPSPLHLLTASATSIRATTTKLSLLTITAPFTASAVASTLQPLNSSVLPSLVTATLLTTPALYPNSFVKECYALSRGCLRDLKILVQLIQTRSQDGKPKSDPAEIDKKAVTEATGKVWEDCDLLLRFSKEGLVGFVVRKANQWLELMKDAVKELEEWDPEEEDIDDQDWLGLDDAGSEDDQPSSTTDPNTKETNTNRATISAGIKDQALKVLSRIPQSIHVVVKQRLEKLPTSTTTATPPPHLKTLNLVLKKARKISDCIDESAESMYMGDPESCLKKAGEARALTIEVVEAVLRPWDGVGTQAESREDLYVKRALVWIQQVGESGNGKDKGNEKGKDGKRVL